MRAPERGTTLAAIAHELTRLLDRYGAADLQAAIREALESDDTMTWDDIGALRDHWPGTFMVKRLQKCREPGLVKPEWRLYAFAR